MSALVRPNDPDREQRECPYTAVTVPVRDPDTGAMTVAVQRAVCGRTCAIYDRKNDRPCFDRLIAAVLSLKDVLRPAVAGVVSTQPSGTAKS